MLIYCLVHCYLCTNDDKVKRTPVLKNVNNGKSERHLFLEIRRSLNDKFQGQCAVFINISIAGNTKVILRPCNTITHHKPTITVRNIYYAEKYYLSFNLDFRETSEAWISTSTNIPI